MTNTGTWKCVLCLLFLQLAVICNLEITSKYGLDDRETSMVHSHFYDDPLSRRSRDVVISSPVKNKVTRNQPYCPRPTKDAELVIGEMLSASLATVVDIYRASTMCLTLC